MENGKPYVVKVSVSVSVSIEGLVSVSVSVSIGDFFEYQYQSRYRLGALLSPGISPGIGGSQSISIGISPEILVSSVSECPPLTLSVGNKDSPNVCSVYLFTHVPLA